MGDELNTLDIFPRMEKWLVAYGIPAEDIMFCTQFVHTGDSAYLVTQEDKEKDQATSEPVT